MTAKPITCRRCKGPRAVVKGLCDTCYRRKRRADDRAARRAAGEAPPKRYPWSRWLDGKAHVVEVNQQPASRKAFENHVRLAADRRGLKATIRHLPGGEVVIQAQPR